MLRAPISHALRASRRRAVAAVSLEAAGLQVGRALVASSRTSGKGDTADSLNSMLMLASVAAVGAGKGGGEGGSKGQIYWFLIAVSGRVWEK